MCRKKLRFKIAKFLRTAMTSLGASIDFVGSKRLARFLISQNIVKLSGSYNLSLVDRFPQWFVEQTTGCDCCRGRVLLSTPFGNFPDPIELPWEIAQQI